MVANGDGPRNHPLLKGLNLPPLGQSVRAAPLVTKTLLFVSEGDQVNVRTPPNGGRKLRAFDKATGKIVWETELPAGTTGTMMTYQVKGLQVHRRRHRRPEPPARVHSLALTEVAARGAVRASLYLATSGGGRSRRSSRISVRCAARPQQDRAVGLDDAHERHLRDDVRRVSRDGDLLARFQRLSGPADFRQVELTGEPYRPLCGLASASLTSSDSMACGLTKRNSVTTPATVTERLLS